MPPPLFTRGASSCLSQERRQGERRDASPRPSAPTYLPLPRSPALRPGCRGPLPMCCERRERVWGPSTVPFTCTPCGGCVPRGCWGGVPGCPATVVSGVWCQALSLPRSPALWGGQSGFRGPYAPGAVGAGVGTQQRPHSARAFSNWRCTLWGWRKGVPGGGAVHRCEGRLRPGAPPPPTACTPGGLSGSVTHVLWARVCGCGGPALSPWLACPVGAACRGGGGGQPPGGVACHRCKGRLVARAVPPPSAHPLQRDAGVPQPVFPGCGRCGREDPAPAPQRAPLRVGVARCWGGGRASPGGVPFAIVRGV